MRATRSSWLGAGLAVAAVGWGATQFVPLLLVYRERLGLTAPVVEGTFAFYVVGLVPGLFLGGPLGRRRGHRVVIVVALLLAVIGSLLLVAAGDLGVAWLFAGRFVTGLSAGAALGDGSAWIAELSARDAAPGERSPAARRTTIAMTAGFAGGPVVASVLAQWAPLPTVLPYLPHLLLALVALPLALRTWQRPVERTDAAIPTPAPRMAPLDRRRFLRVVVPLAPWVFGSAALALVYVPAHVAPQLGGFALVFTGVCASLAPATGIAVQPLARWLDAVSRRRLLLVSLLLAAAGAAAAALAIALLSPVLAIVASLVLGAAYGCCQVTGFAETQALAAPGGLAFLTAVYVSLSYLGFALPTVLSSLEALLPAPDLLLIVVALAVLTAGATFAASRRRTR